MARSSLIRSHRIHSSKAGSRKIRNPITRCLILTTLLAAGCAMTDDSGGKPEVPASDGAPKGTSSGPAPGHVPAPLFDEIPDTRSFPLGAGDRVGRSGDAGTTHAVARVTRHEPGRHEPSPDVQDRAPGRADRDHTLDARVDAVLAELVRYADRPESELADGERLKKYRLERELIALHYLLPSDSESRYLDPLLESLADPAGPPITGHLLMVAAFYHDIDLEQLRDETLARLDVPAAARATPRLELRNFCLCREVRRLRDYSPLGKRVLRRGQEVILYGELTHLKNVRENGQYVSGIEVIATLEDDRGTALDRQELSGPEGDRLLGSEPTPENFFQYPYRIPRDLEGGGVRLVVEVRDIYSGARARGEASFRIRR